MGALQQAERELRRLHIENMRIQIRMLEALIAEEERLLCDPQKVHCGCDGRNEMMVSEN